jgi:hypothetical protein
MPPLYPRIEQVKAGIFLPHTTRYKNHKATHFSGERERESRGRKEEEEKKNTPGFPR